MTFQNKFLRTAALTAGIGSCQPTSTIPNSSSAFVDEIPYSPGVLDQAASLEANTMDWSESIDELLRIRNLEDDWDGGGSRAPTPEIVDGAIRFAQYFASQRLSPPDHTSAGVNGTIQFEFFFPSAFMEIEIVTQRDAELRMLIHATKETLAIDMKLGA
jgi:hypothetical protein